MTLDVLLLSLSNDLELLTGEPKHLDVWRVLDYAAEQNTEPIAGSLFLIDQPADLQRAKHLILMHRQIAFVVAKGLLQASDSTWMTKARAAILQTREPRIRLDLSARIQRVLSSTDAESLPVDTVARARQDLVEDLLLNRYQDLTALTARAKALGVELEQARLVMLVIIDNFERFYLLNEARGELHFQHLKGRMLLTVRNIVMREDTLATVTQHGEGVVALLTDTSRAEALAEEVAVAIRKELRFVPLAVATGAPKSDHADLAKSYQEAMLALQLRRRLRMKARHIAFSRITGYALLQQIGQVPEVTSLLAAEIRALGETEQGQYSRLVETLAAYFDAGSSLKRAADALNIHPKTLRYRLDKIEELLGPGALEGEKRLLYYLAAKLHIWMRL